MTPRSTSTKPLHPGQLTLEVAAMSCTHPYGIPSEDSAYCPDCQQTFPPGSKDFKRIQRRQLELPLEPTPCFSPGTRIQVTTSILTEDIGRTGTIQQPWDSRSQANPALRVLLDGDALCRAFSPEAVELLPLEQRPLEPTPATHHDEPASLLHDTLARLEQERDRLAELAADAPATGWIESGMVKGKNFRQTWWRGVEKDGKKTTIYIGKDGSPAHKRAIAAQQARRHLKSVLKQISSIKKELGDV